MEKGGIVGFSRWTLGKKVIACETPQTFYADADKDGYGNATSSVEACTQPAGYVVVSGDCNDGDAAINPGATEICNGLDDNCNRQADENVLKTYYADVDSDSYGNAASSIESCSQPKGYVTNSLDCNDANSSSYPGSTEICSNSLDDDCDGQTNEGCSTIPAITINDVTVYESTGVAVLTVTLSSAVSSAVKVRYKTINGTASHPKDYQRVTGELSFSPGQTSKTISVQIKKDNIIEDAKWFTIQLSNPQNATISNATGKVTIMDAATLHVNAKETKDVSILLQQIFDVVVSDNPTHSGFTIQTVTNSNERVSFEVTDLNGRTIEKFETTVLTKPVLIGNAYRSGLYLLKVRQGTKQKTVKLVKL